MLGLLKFILRHPLNAEGKARALSRFLRWQFTARLINRPMVMPFVDSSVLVMERGMTGATGNWYCGLHEHVDMAFLLHVLRPEDLFADIGANVGSYTVLAGAAVGAQVVALEPIPGTYQKLLRNVVMNAIGDRVACHNLGAGSAEAVLQFTADLDTVNHVVTADEAQQVKTMDVPVRRLDDLLSEHENSPTPRLIKIDVEGWEARVLKGMPDILADPDLAAIIMETNDNTGRYGDGDQVEILRIMHDAGFRAYTYDPFGREVVEGGTSTNTIFIRDLDLVRGRIATAPRFQLVNGNI